MIAAFGVQLFGVQLFGRHRVRCLRIQGQTSTCFDPGVRRFLDTTFLTWATTVVGNRCHVLYQLHFQSGGL